MEDSLQYKINIGERRKYPRGLRYDLCRILPEMQNTHGSSDMTCDGYSACFKISGRGCISCSVGIYGSRRYPTEAVSASEAIIISTHRKRCRNAFCSSSGIVYADIFGYQVYWLSHYFNVHESAEHLKILNIVSVYDDDMLSGNGLLVVLHIHTGLKKH